MRRLGRGPAGRQTPSSFGSGSQALPGLRRTGPRGAGGGSRGQYPSPGAFEDSPGAGAGAALPARRSLEEVGASATRAGGSGPQVPRRPARAPGVRRRNERWRLQEGETRAGLGGGRGAAGGWPARASSADARPAPERWGVRGAARQRLERLWAAAGNLPDRLLGRRGVAGLGPRRAAAPRDGGAEVLLPGKGMRGGAAGPGTLPAPHCNALPPGQVGRWRCLFLHPSGRSPLCSCSLAGAPVAAARLGWCEQVPTRRP